MLTGKILAAIMFIQPIAATSNSSSSSQDPTLPLSSDPTFNFFLLTPLQFALTGGADISPVLGVANTIIPGNMTSYYHEFYKLANQTKHQAQDPDSAYDAINVRDTWFSASNYFRRADFLLHSDWSNPELMALWAEQTSAFDKAIAALPVPGQRVRIPTKRNYTVEAIWYGTQDSSSSSNNSSAKEKRPTLVVVNGFDASQEDSYHSFCSPALLRGWNCMTYEGPGQPTVRRYQNVGFTPEWEHATAPVLDWLSQNKADVVDTDRVALLGNSFGSLLALRAAAFDQRIKAVVAIDGIWDFYASATQPVPSDLLSLFEAGERDEFDRQLLQRRHADDGSLTTKAAWGLDQGLWSFYTHSPFEFLTQAKGYKVADFVDRIRVPVFIGNAQYETFVPGQPAQLREALGDLGTLHDFNGTAGYHCQTGAGQEMTHTIFAWLNKTL